MSLDDSELPAVDTRRLAEILGGPVVLRDKLDRMAARVITDAFGQTTTPQAALANASVWIELARSEGVDAGVRAEKERWEWNVKKIFGIR